MDDEELLAKFDLRPWTRDEFQEQQRIVALGTLLWGDDEHLRKQLLAASHEIPKGLELSDLKKLGRFANVSLTMSKRKTLTSAQSIRRTIEVAGREFSPFEARCVVVRRAIAALGEN